MIGLPIAAKREWSAVLEYFNMTPEQCEKYPFGEYFTIKLNKKELIFFSTNPRKTNACAASQYMICKFNLDCIIVAGTCAGIDERYKNLDIIIPNLAVQYDCTVKEIEPLIKQSFSIEMTLPDLGFEYITGTIGTADKAVVMYNDYIELQQNGITIADTESACIAYICKRNGIKCFIIKGISDSPKNSSDPKAQNEQQIAVYIENTPKCMNIILKDYLPGLLDYLDK